MSGPIDQSMLRLAEWQGIAAIQGRTVAQVAADELKARAVSFRQSSGRAGQVWGDIPEAVRSMMLCMVTDRSTARAVRWDQLTEQEREAVGAYARGLVRELHGRAGWLR